MCFFAHKNKRIDTNAVRQGESESLPSVNRMRGRSRNREREGERGMCAYALAYSESTRFDLELPPPPFESIISALDTVTKL